MGSHWVYSGSMIKLCNFITVHLDDVFLFFLPTNAPSIEHIKC